MTGAEAMRQSIIGSLTGRSTVSIERGPVARFAAAVTDGDPVFSDVETARERGLAAIPVPPTFSFSALGFWGTFSHDEEQNEGGDGEIQAVLGELLERGGVALHAEEELEFVRPLFVGDVLGRVGTIDGRYEKKSGASTLTFVRILNEYRDQHGALVLTTRTTLVHKIASEG